MSESTFFLCASGALLLALSLASWHDVRTRRIPNWLTASSFLVALAMRSFLGFDAVLDGLQGAGLALLLMLPLFALGAFGGGDVKLLVAVGAFMGPRDLLVALAATAVAGAVLAVAESARRGILLPLLLNTGRLAKYYLTLGRSGTRPELTTQGAVTIPYGVAIALGSSAVWFLR